MSQRETFVATLTHLLETEPKVVLLLGDISTFAFRHAMEKFPDRCLNLGITECASVGFAAGLAREGYYPFYHSIDAFAVRRAYEFWYLDFGISALKGCCITVGHDSDYASLGPTHEGRFCDALMWTVPGMMVYEPYSDSQAEHMIRQSHSQKMLSYIRLRA